MKKIFVILGNFGSGKTELALNLALSAVKTGRTMLVDLDMVNTYFRLNDRRKLVTAAGIRLVAPNYASKNIETLSLPGEISSAFHLDYDTVIFDAGGDPAGARALGRFHEDFMNLEKSQLEVLNVINLRRPMSGTPDKIIDLMHYMSDYSRLPVTGLVNNTNLAELTSYPELADGYTALREVSQRSGIPVRFTAGTSHLLRHFLSQEYDPAYVGTALELNIYMHRDWDSFTKLGL